MTTPSIAGQDTVSEQTHDNEFNFAARAEHLVGVRHLVERIAGQKGLTRSQISDLLTAVDEAAANAIRHGSPQGEKNTVRVRCEPTVDGIQVEVRDCGAGFVAANRPIMPGPDALGGRGLPLMCALADTVEIASTPQGTTIVLKKKK